MEVDFGIVFSNQIRSRRFRDSLWLEFRVFLGDNPVDNRWEVA